MSDALQILLNSGGLYLALAAAICVLVGVGATRRLFQSARRAEPPEPRHRPRRKDWAGV